MVQTVDVIAIFDKMMREPKPVRFKIYDKGHWKSVNVERIFNIEWMRLDGKVQIVYNCASRSCNGQMINYKLRFIHQDIRWEMEMDGPIHTGILKKSFLWSVPQIIGWDDTGPFPLFHTPWLVSGRNGPAENHSERE